MDADRVTSGLVFACATVAEERAARDAHVGTKLVGLGCSNGVPPGPLISFGLAGALRDDLPVGVVIDAERVVDRSGVVLWQGGPLGIPHAVRGTILATDRVVDDPEERRRLHQATGADAADLESGPIARSGEMYGAVRAVSDTPRRPLRELARGAKEDGRYNWSGLAGAFLAHPLRSIRSAREGMKALQELTRALERLREAAVKPGNLLGEGTLRPL